MPRTIAAHAEQAHRSLRLSSPRARQRTLEPDDIAEAILAHLRHVRRVARQAPEDRVTTTVRGGYVARSYGYRAEADEVVIVGDIAAELEITARRTYAQSRQRGIGDAVIHRARRPGQPQGRIL